MPRLDKNTVKKTLKGYERGSAIAERERLEQLHLLSHEESLTIFTNLWKIWEKNKSKADIQVLDNLKIKYLIKRRERIDRLARWKQVHDKTA